MSSSSSYEDKYSLKRLRDFFASKRISILHQFVLDGSIAFIKIKLETIEDNMLIYFPSKYDISPDYNMPHTEIIPYDLSEKDLLYIQQQTEKDMKDNYGELVMDDNDEYDEHFKEINISDNKDIQIRKSLMIYTNQLNKFKNCVCKLKYKLGILSNNVLCTINRHNEIESYLVKDGKGLISNIIDGVTDEIHYISQEMYIIIDLPSFYEKLPTVKEDVIKFYKNFYYILNKAHTKQTAQAEIKLKHHQVLISKMIAMYKTKSNFLDMIEKLHSTYESAKKQEEQFIQRIKILEEQKVKNPELINDTERTFKLTKNEKDLQSVRENIKKVLNTLSEIKKQYHNFLITYDSTISETNVLLKNIEESIKRLGLSLDGK
jgi:hypothetical protein